jgi:hypothetical protein
MLRHAHPYAPVVPAVVTAGVILVASVVLKPTAQPRLGMAARATVRSE